MNRLHSIHPVLILLMVWLCFPYTGLSQETMAPGAGAPNRSDTADAPLLAQETGSTGFMTESESLSRPSTETSLFFRLGSSELETGSDAYLQFMGFLDSLAGQSHGRKILFSVIGSASSIGPPDTNAILSEKRARTVVAIIDRHLVDIPHDFVHIIGLGDRYSPETGPITLHGMFQYAKVVATFEPEPFKADRPESMLLPLPAAADVDEPPSASEDASSAFLNPPFVNRVGMVFVRVPPGRFTMGSRPEELGRDNDEVPHPVEIENGFFMQATEVTQGQWQAVMGDNPSFFNDCGDDCPVNRVSWNDTQEFIARLNRLENTDKYRLPREAEWEYACRAGSAGAFANGDMDELACSFDRQLETMGWYRDNSASRVHPAAQKLPNAWGIFDMHGNVWEWCQEPKTPYVTAPAAAVEPEMEPGRVVRGGAWNSTDRDCRSANRLSTPPCTKSGGIGFRVVRDP